MMLITVKHGVTKVQLIYRKPMSKPGSLVSVFSSAITSLSVVEASRTLASSALKRSVMQLVNGYTLNHCCNSVAFFKATGN